AGAASCKKGEPEAPGAPAQASSSAPLTAVSAPDVFVYAGSSSLRVVDSARGAVVASLPLHNAIYGIEFDRSGKSAFVATGGGLFELDVATNAFTQLTSIPASYLHRDDSTNTLSVLQHEVIVHKNGTRDIEPFHLVSLDLGTRRIVSDEEIGPD